MAAPNIANAHQHRQSFPRKSASSPQPRMSGDLILLATLMGVTRAIFAVGKRGPVGQTGGSFNTNLSHGLDSRGRRAEKPTDIPAKGWKDIAWRLYHDIQNDRVLLVAAGVTFYAISRNGRHRVALRTFYRRDDHQRAPQPHLRVPTRGCA